jgi:S-adenosylmethionine decarboxylase
MDTLGRHVIAELDGCDPTLLRDSVSIRRLLIEAARKSGATVLADETFEFRNGGVSGFVLLAESHISIHTWPEHQYAAIDIYTCGAHTTPDLGCQHLAETLHAGQLRMTSLSRGLPARFVGHEHQFSSVNRGRPIISSLTWLSNSA